MTKRKPMDRAKSAGEKIVEGGKEIWEGLTEVTTGVCGAVINLLEAGYDLASAGVSDVSSKLGNKPKAEVSRLQAKKKKKLKDAGKDGKDSVGGAKKAGTGVYHTTKGTLKGVGNTLLAGYHLLDAGDKKIGEKIEDKMNEKGKNTKGKVGHFVRTNIAKILLGASLLTYGGVETNKVIQDKKGDNIEMISVKHVKEVFGNKDVMNDFNGSGEQLEDKRENRYLGNDEAWNVKRGDYGIQERKKVIEGFCRMVESGDIDMIFEKADAAGVPRQCIYLALAESGWQAGANSGVAGGYWQFTKPTARSYGLIDKDGNDYRSDKVRSTEAAMKHLKDNYGIVCNYAKQLGYNLSESDKWILSFYMFNGSPVLVRAGMRACGGNIDEYSKELVALAKKNGGRINGKRVNASENANYVPRILGIQDALEQAFKDNDYDLKRVKETENILSMHEKTTADSMYEDYQKQSSGLSTKKKIDKLNEIKSQYEQEYNDKQISKKYYEGAIRVIDEDIDNLEGED